MLVGPAGFLTAGVPLLIAGVHRLLFARLANMLSDGDGLRSGLDWRGATSLKPCFKHLNVLMKGSGLAHLRPGFVDIACCDRTMLRKWTSDKVFRAVDLLEGAHRRVQDGRMTKAAYRDLEMATGLNRNPEGILASRALRPHFDVDCVTYDWVHTVLQHGVLNVEVEQMMLLFAPFGVTRQVVQTFLRDEAWSFPNYSEKKSRALHRIFDEHRESKKKPTIIKCTSSELLGVYGLLRSLGSPADCQHGAKKNRLDCTRSDFVADSLNLNSVSSGLHT